MKEKFKKYQHLVKPYDIIIVIALFILSFLPNVIFAVQQMTKQRFMLLLRLMVKKCNDLN